MTRKKMVAGNWKMNLLFNEAIVLADSIQLNNQIGCDVIIAPPNIYLHALKSIADKNNFKLAAQNCAEHDKGAFTGEVSASMLNAIDTEYVIIGHSERRSLFGETNAIVNAKTKSCIHHFITPIVCVGESLSERNADLHFNIIKSQISEALFDLNKDEITKIIIAYEPVWAIGTGLTATPDQAQEMHAYIRKCIAENYNQEIANQIRILYGGSCNENNAATLFSCPDIDGGLIGGASLKAESFMKIIHAAMQ
jgi:triosephosphate isomerase